MVAWTTVRNEQLDAASSGERARQFLALMYYVLDAAGWYLVGQGGGTSGGFDWENGGEASAQFPSYPSYPNANAWFVMRNNDDIEVMFYQNASTYVVPMVWSMGGFSQGSSDEDTHPAVPADGIQTGVSQVEMGHSSQNPFYHVAYADDGNQFIFFSRVSGFDWAGGALVKLEHCDAADVLPTYCPYWAFMFGVGGQDVWTETRISDDSSGYSHARGYHPTGNIEKEYNPCTIKFHTYDIMDDIPADPISGEQARVELWCGCYEAGFRHIRGVIPGIFRVPTNLATGDKLDSNTWIVIGDYAVPWGSSDVMSF